LNLKDLPASVVKQCEKIISQCEASPELFATISNLFDEAHQIYTATPTAAAMGSMGAFEAFEIINELDDLKDGLQLCAEAGIKIDQYSGATLDDMKTALIAHYSLELVDEMARPDVLAACEEVGLKLDAKASLDLLKKELKAYFRSVTLKEVYGTSFMATNERYHSHPKTSNPASAAMMRTANPVPEPPTPPARVSSAAQKTTALNQAGAFSGVIEAHTTTFDTTTGLDVPNVLLCLGRSILAATGEQGVRVAPSM